MPAICKDIKTPPETVMSYWRNHCRCPDPDDSVDITGDRKAVGTAPSAVSVSGFTQQIAFHFTKKGISVSVYASGSSTCSILLRQSVPIAAQTSGDSSRPWPSISEWMPAAVKALRKAAPSAAMSRATCEAGDRNSGNRKMWEICFLQRIGSRD